MVIHYLKSGTASTPLTSQLPYLLTRSTASTGAHFILVSTSQQNWYHFQYILGLFPTSSQRQLHRQCSRPRLRGWCLTSSWGLQLPLQLTRQMPRGRPRLSWRWWRDMMACKWLVQITLNDLPANRCTKCIYPEYNPAAQQEIVRSYKQIRLCKYPNQVSFPYTLS